SGRTIVARTADIFISNVAPGNATTSARSATATRWRWARTGQEGIDVCQKTLFGVTKQWTDPVAGQRFIRSAQCGGYSVAPCTKEPLRFRRGSGRWAARRPRGALVGTRKRRVRSSNQLEVRRGVPAAVPGGVRHAIGVIRNAAGGWGGNAVVS